MLAAVRSATLVGVDGQPVTVEVHVSSGLPAYSGRRSARRRGPRVARTGPRRGVVVGPRVAATAHHRQPRARRRAQVRLRARARGRARRCSAPTTRSPPVCSTASRCSGELGLDGSVRPVPGTLALVDALARAGRRRRGRARSPTPPRPRSSAACGCARRAPSASSGRASRARSRGPTGTRRGRSRRRRRRTLGDDELVDLADVRGLAVRPAGARGRGRRRPPPAVRAAHPAPARRCSPGASAPSSRRSSTAEALEVTRIHSAAGERDRPGGSSTAGRSARRTTPRRPPRSSAAGAAGPPGRGHARAPGHACSSTSSASSRPPRSTRCASRSRSGSVRISRQPVSLTFPAAFQLVACTNPCPCGLGDAGLPLQRRAARALPAPAVARRSSTASTCGCASTRRKPRDVPGECSADVARPGRGRVRAAAARATPTGRGRRTRTWPPARSSRAAPARARRRRRLARSSSPSAASPVGAPPGSDAWPAPSPTSTTPPTSPPTTSTRRRCSGATCRERRPRPRSSAPPAARSGRGRGRDARLPARHDTRARSEHSLERGGGPGRRAGRARARPRARRCSATARRRPICRRARRWHASGRSAAHTARVDAAAARARHPRVRRGSAGLPDRRAPGHRRRCCSPRATRPDALGRPAGGGGRARARQRLTGSPTPTSSARSSPGPGSPW